MTVVEETHTAHEHERAQRWLRAYVRQVAAGLGVGPEPAWCALADEAEAYVAVDQRARQRPDRDAALVWHETHGWALGIAPDPGADPLILARYGPHLLPPPGEVARFATTALTGAHPTTAPALPSGEPGQVRAVRARLADWARKGARR